MPRARTHERADLIATAMHQFWRNGYDATSMDDLLRATGASRHALYSQFDGKEALFLACLEAYPSHVVTPAFADVEREGAAMEEINAYFTTQISFARQLGLPGPGCLMANSMTEVAPHWPAVLAHVSAHNARLDAGFENALSNAFPDQPKKQLRAAAQALSVFTQGLWSYSRTTKSASDIQKRADTFLAFLTRSLETPVSKETSP